MKSFSLLMNENTGDIVLINRHRLDFPEHLDCGYQEIKEGSRNELEDWVREYFDTNQVADEKQMYLTLQ
jgi:hypothetical protein